MRYWLFMVMHDIFPSLWKTELSNGVAAQHYPPGWSNENSNIKWLSQISKGDMVVSAFRAHRFGGYGEVVSDFTREGESLDVPHVDDSEDLFEFREQIGVDWVALPTDGVAPYLDCHEMKAQGYDVDLVRGRCIKETDRETFLELRRRLLEAGADSV